MLTTIALRIAAGFAGAVPPIIAVMLLDRAAYGHVMGNCALALLLLGPMLAYTTQGYLRELVTTEESAGKQPSGALLAALYTLVCSGVLLVLAGASVVSATDALYVGVLLVVFPLAKLQESWFVATNRQSAAIVLFYLAPPLVLSASILALRSVVPIGDFWLIALGYLAANTGCLIVSVVMQPPAARRLLLPRWPRDKAFLRRDLRSAWLLMVNGGLFGVAENLPVLFLNWLGLATVVPSLELARKMAMVPGVLVQAVNMRVFPRMVHHVAVNDWTAFVTDQRLSQRVLLVLGLGYCGVVLAGLLVFGDHLGSVLDLPITFLLLVNALVWTFAAPYGAAVLALKCEAWWVLGAIAGLVVQVAISIGLLDLLGAVAVAAGMLGLSVVETIAIVAAAVLVRRRRERETMLGTHGIDGRTSDCSVAEPAGTVATNVRVLYVTPPSEVFAGTERVIHVVANELARSNGGLDVTVLNFKAFSELADERPAYTLRILEASRLRGIVAPVARFLRDNEFDLIVCAHIIPTVVIWFAAKLAGSNARIVPHLHSDPRLEECGSLANRIFFFVFRRLVAQEVPTMLSVSTKLVEVAKSTLTDRCPVWCVPNPGRDLATRPPARAEASVFLHVGRLLCAQKAQDVLLRAFAKVRTERPDAILRIVGSGPDEAMLRVLARTLSIDDSVEFLGFQPDVQRFYENAAVFVLPSRTEGFGLVLIEALNFGLPLVVTDGNLGLEEIVTDPRIGQIAPVDDVDALARAMSNALAEPWSEEAAQFRRQQGQRYRAPVVAAEHARALKDIAARLRTPFCQAAPDHLAAAE